MVSRRGIGATVAALVVFSSVLVANYTLVSGAQQAASLASLADSEEAVAVSAQLLRGAAALRLLDQLQGALSSGLSCSNPAESISGTTYGPLALAAGGLSETATAGPALGREGDNLSILGPFDGIGSGSFGLSVLTSVTGQPGNGAVSYDRTESHFVGIPADVQGPARSCLAAASAVAAKVSELGSSMCNGTLLASAISSVSDEVSHPGPGLDGSLSYSVEGPACSVGFTLTVSEPGVLGPEGPFAVTLEESGSVSPSGALQAPA
jgi:hypothetical protein